MILSLCHGGSLHLSLLNMQVFTDSCIAPQSFLPYRDRFPILLCWCKSEVESLQMLYRKHGREYVRVVS